MADAYLSLIDIVKKKARELPREADLELDDLPTDDIDLLKYRCSAFIRIWGDLIAPPIAAESKDRTDYLRLLHSQAFRKAILQIDPQAFEEAFQAESATLLAEEHTAASLWRELLLHGFNISRDDIARNRLKAFDYLLAENDGTLLTLVRSRKTIDDLPQHALKGKHDFRIIVRPAYMPAGMLVSIASFRDPNVSDSRYISFTWLHNKEWEAIAKTLCRIFVKLLAVNTEVHWSIYTPDKVTEGRSLAERTYGDVLNMLQEVNAGEGDIFAPMQNVTYCHLQASRRIGFADMTLLEGTEMQVNLTFRADEWRHGVGDELLRAVSETAEISMPVLFIRRLLEPALRALELMKT